METHEALAERIIKMQQEINQWRDIAYRLTMPHHDDNCEFAAQCSYCLAIQKASKR